MIQKLMLLSVIIVNISLISLYFLQLFNFFYLLKNNFVHINFAYITESNQVFENFKPFNYKLFCFCL